MVRASATESPPGGRAAGCGACVQWRAYVGPLTAMSSSTSIAVTVLGGQATELNAAMFVGPQRREDETGTGLVVDGTGVVTSVLPDPGIAFRWGEFREGDEILTISGNPYKQGEPLAANLVDGKDAYLVRLRRRESDSTFERVNAMLGSLFSAGPKWDSEEQATRAWAAAGDHHRGISRGPTTEAQDEPSTQRADVTLTTIRC